MIVLKNITKSFNVGGINTNVLKGIDLNINRGEFVAIIGQSGSGKSTLMNILGCLDTPTNGEYILFGKNISKFNKDELSTLRLKKFGFIFQRYNLLGSIDAKQNVILPAIYAGSSKDYRLKRAKDILTKLELKEKFDTLPNHLSGGQQQRVSIARALMNGGEILLCDEPTGALDSLSGIMVMEILKELHKEGHTIIVVTHDKQIASWADRIIEIKDGNIIKDNKKNSQIYQYKEPKQEIKSKISNLKNRFFESFKMSINTIRIHKFRSFLTMLGIVIGIISVICVVALAKGSEEKILENINNIGTNTISIYPGKGFGDLRSNKVKSLSVDDANLLGKLDYVDFSTPKISTSGLLVYSNQNFNANLKSGGENTLQISGIKILIGRNFTKDDVMYSKSNMIIDEDTKDTFFPNTNPIGKIILFNKQPFTIIGVTKRDDNSISDDNLVVYAPYTTTMNKITGDREIRSIVVKVKDGINPQIAEQSIIDILTVRRGSKNFFTRNADTIRKTIENTLNTLSLMTSGIAFISLMVGGIGVMNIMLVSVVERTKEIGIRMAIGAKSKDIMTQFLIESILLCAIGGIIGVSLAYVIGYIFNLVSAEVKMIFSLASIFIALGVSSLIGIIFGYMPASNASKLNPIDALLRE